MADENQVKSWLEGLAEDDWRMYHSDSEVQNRAKAALDLLKEQDDEVELCERCGRIRLKSYRQK